MPQKQKHSPEPWDAAIPQGYDESQAYDILDTYSGPVAEVAARGDALRIVACVNACEGLNPEAVPELVEALETLMDAALVCWPADAHRPVRLAAITRAQDALAKVQGASGRGEEETDE